MKFELEGIDMRKKVAKKSGTTCHVFVPKEWEGKEVAVILIG